MDDPGAEKKPMKPQKLHERFSHGGDMPIPGDIVRSITSDSSQGRAWLEFHSGKTVEIALGTIGGAHTRESLKASSRYSSAIAWVIVLVWLVLLSMFVIPRR
jgi:hypothetical protein